MRFLSSVLNPVLCDFFVTLVRNKDGGSEELRRRAIFLAKDEGDLEDEELLGFYLYLTELPPPIPHRNYPWFELSKYTDEECLLNFRFQKVNVLHLVTALRLPNRFLFKNGTIATSLEGLCVLLCRLAYPNRLTDMIAPCLVDLKQNLA